MRIAICDDLQTERQKTIEALDSVIRNFPLMNLMMEPS